VIGIIGTGNIGKITAEILKGFGPSRLLGNDAYPSEELK
jgi:phosphoglycerate dehydrogenase-like enzyme